MAVTPLPRRLARMLSWHRRKLAAALAFVAVLVGVWTIGPQGPPTVAVLVTARPVAAGHRLTAADVELRRLPEGALPTGSQREPAEAVGRLGAAALPAGQVLTTLSTVTERQAGPGRVIAPLRLTDAGLAALLAPGDLIDVVAADPETGRSSVVVSDVRVVTVPEVEPAGGPLGSTSTTAGVLCLVSVARSDAATLAGAAAGQLGVVWSGG